VTESDRAGVNTVDQPPAGYESGTARSLAQAAKLASRVLATVTGETRNRAICRAADLLIDHQQELLAANAADLAAAKGELNASQMDRLRLDSSRIESMAGGLLKVARLPDPVGQVVDGWRLPNGVAVERVRVPLGVIAIIYENRPNVTSDAAGLCLKSANAVVLRGSSTALRTNLACARLIRSALAEVGLPEDAVAVIPDTSRKSAIELMQARGLVDCLIPRGGPSLVASIRDHATVPYVIDGDGNCHLYVDASADLDMALRILANGKLQRPSVCNALESLVVHAEVAPVFLPRAAEVLSSVELVGDEQSRQLVRTIGVAQPADFATEFLALKMSVKVVASLDDAIEHINQNGSGHSEAICTGDLASARRFCQEVDAAAVLVNASTRLVDGEQLGLGAEIGISTQKLHARGPMGPADLTCVKYVLSGDGQIRT
jgi:glutamate-5-semialdehyde dehydrogenase